jgi:hypothetical protein
MAYGYCFDSGELKAIEFNKERGTELLVQGSRFTAHGIRLTVRNVVIMTD